MAFCVPPFPFTQLELRPDLGRAETIATVNRLVNLMRPHEGEPTTSDPWVIAPEHGAWCHDYAVTKQWMLKALGIESRLCECRLPEAGPNDPHHMVLLVDDVALDNLTPIVGPMQYRILRTQLPDNIRNWDAP